MGTDPRPKGSHRSHPNILSLVPKFPTFSTLFDYFRESSLPPLLFKPFREVFYPLHLVSLFTSIVLETTPTNTRLDSLKTRVRVSRDRTRFWRTRGQTEVPSYLWWKFHPTLLPGHARRLPSQSRVRSLLKTCWDLFHHGGFYTDSTLKGCWSLHPE